MSSEPPKKSIEEIQKRLERTERVSRDRGQLLDERKQLERQLNQAQGDLEAVALATHRELAELEPEQGAPDTHAMVKQEKLAELEEQRERINALKRKQREIDHLLDELEGNTSEKIKLLREQLVESLLEAYPADADRYREAKEALSAGQVYFQELEQMHAALQKIHDYLETALELWQKQKKRSLLHYIFGKSPYSSISDQLGHAAVHAEVALEALANKVPVMQSQITLQAFLPNLQQHLERIQRHCAGTWHFNQFLKIYGRDRDSLLELMRELIQFESEQQEKLRSYEQRIQDWIAKHS